jgi:6-phosphogluconolactonase (cycloisomerase 2 family)
MDKQDEHITALNRQSCGRKDPVHCRSIRPDRIIAASYNSGLVGIVPIANLAIYV